MRRLYLVWWVVFAIVAVCAPVTAPAQQIPGDFLPGAFFGLELVPNLPNSVLTVFVTDPNATPRQPQRVMEIPNAWTIGRQNNISFGYDVVRHLLYPIVRDSVGKQYLLKIDPVNRTHKYVKELVPNSPDYCSGSDVDEPGALSNATWVDASTGYVFCSRYNLNAFPSPPSLVIVRIDPDTGETKHIVIESENYREVDPRPFYHAGPAIAVNPADHALYAIRAIRTTAEVVVRGELVKIDTRSMEMTNLGVISDNYVNVFFGIAYDAPSNSIFGYNEHCYNPYDSGGSGYICDTVHKLWKLDLDKLGTNTQAQTAVPISDFDPSAPCRYPPRLGVDELHHLLYVDACNVLKTVDISKSDLTLVNRSPAPATDYFATRYNEAFNDGVVRQAILLDWTNPSSTGWKRKWNSVMKKVQVVPTKTTTSSLVSMSEDNKKLIFEQVRKIYAGDPTSEQTHIHLPILDYRGPKRATEENQQHATYVRFVDRSTVLPTSLPTRINGKAWNTVPSGGCHVDRYNQRRSGEVVVFTDATRTAEDIGITAAHEAGHALGLRHGYHSSFYPLLVMDYGRLYGSLEKFPPALIPILEPPTPTKTMKPDPHGFATSDALFHLRRYVLGEPSNSSLVTSLKIGDWDGDKKKLFCKKITGISSSTSNLFDFAVLATGEAEEDEGDDALVFLENVPTLAGVEAIAGKGVPLQIVASSVAGGDWDLYFVPANDPSQLEIPDTALVPGIFNGKIMKYSPVTNTFSEVGTFSMNITEFETPPPPGPPLPPNNDPVANAGPDQTLQLPLGATSLSVTLNGTGSSDADGDSLTYFWSGPFGVLTDATVSADIPAGRHVVTLGVSDGKGGSSSDTATITVNVATNVPGDFDGDRDVDRNDWKILARDLNKTVLNSSCGTKCDLDRDGKITIRDAYAFVQLCTRPFCRTEKFQGNTAAEDQAYKELLQRLK